MAPWVTPLPRVSSATVISSDLTIRSNVNVFDLSIRHQQTALILVILVPSHRAIELLPREPAIVGMNAFPDQGVGRLDRFIESHDPIGFFRPEDLLSAELPGEAPHVTEPLGLGQIGFAPAQRALGPLLILDVVSRGIPSDHLAVFIAQRHAPDEEPAIFAVSSADALLHLERLS